MNKNNYIPENDKERDPFLEEAMEGWEQFPNARFKWFKTKARFSLFLFGKSWSWLPAGTKWMIGSIAAVSTATIITVSTLVIRPQNDQMIMQQANNETKDQIENTQTSQDDDATDNITEEETINITDQSEDVEQEITEPDHLEDEEIAIANETTNTTTTRDNRGYDDNTPGLKSNDYYYSLSGGADKDDAGVVDEIDVKKMERLVAPSNDRTVAALPWLNVHDFKIVDYDMLRTDLDMPVVSMNQSLNPRYSSNAEKEKMAMEDAVIQYDTLSYKQYLASALLMIKQQNYPEAQRQLKVLEKKYPDDENVIFYTGYMYYQQGSFSLAIPYFEKAINSTYKAFATDAEWLLGNSLLNMGKTSEACVIFRMIVTKNNFYSKDARKLLKLHDHE